MQTPRFNGRISFSATIPRKNAQRAAVAFCKGFAMPPNREPGRSISTMAEAERPETQP